MPVVVARRHPKPFARLSGPDKLKRFQRTCPEQAAALVQLMDIAWQRHLDTIRRGPPAPVRISARHRAAVPRDTFVA